MNHMATIRFSWTNIFPQFDYAKGSPESAELTETIKKLKSSFPVNIPIQISGANVSHSC